MNWPKDSPTYRELPALKLGCYWASIFFFVIAYTGCRSIRQTVNNRESIEARQSSREGLAAMHHGRWDQAEDLFQSALKLCQSDDRAHWGMGEVLWQRGDRNKAIEHVEKAVDLSGGAPELRVRLGMMYLNTGRIDDAERESVAALKKGRSLASAWSLRGHVLVQRDLPDEALAAYHRAMSIDHQDSNVIVSIASIYRKQQRYDRLLATIDRIPRDSMVRQGQARVAFLRGVAMRELGQSSAARLHLHDALKLGLNSPDVYYELAITDFHDGFLTEAQRSVAAALTQDRTHNGSLQLAERIQTTQQQLALESELSPPHTR